jgi:DNA repair protein RecO (recombination protein O)
VRWSEEGIVINTKRLGENQFIASALMKNKGKYLGVVPARSKSTPLFQPGTKMLLHWKARLAEHLGSWSGDLLFSPLAQVFENSLSLAALSSACTLIDISLPEREPHPDIYESFHKFIYALGTSSWFDGYFALEQALLKNAGMVFDLSCCAATGVKEDLVYLSPRTGRAVSREAGAPYHEKLLKLPSFLIPSPFERQASKDTEDMIKALDIMEVFLNRFILEVHHLKIPSARHRLKDKLHYQLQAEKKL